MSAFGIFLNTAKYGLFLRSEILLIFCIFLMFPIEIIFCYLGASYMRLAKSVFTNVFGDFVQFFVNKMEFLIKFILMS